MRDNNKAFRTRALVFGIIAVLMLAACSTPGRIGETPGKIGEMSKFDITAASPEDIAKALKEDGRVAISGGILFETDSAKLAPSSANLVSRLAQMMNNNPDVKVAVVGHTDSTGDYQYNIRLSERRAKAMVDAIAKQGISLSRLAAVGVGPLSPAATNDTNEGRAHNRRVELVLIH